MSTDRGRRSAAETTGSVYDGFISYSHAADDLLAPRLQSALQRFAKPWWKRRAVRIFRDESSLSANPHLWSSITEALDTSGWFVLLLSPDAAQSEWVNQEISYWVEHRDPSRILPVVTDGEFSWEDGDVAGSATPDALRGVFEAEPRWVDLRGVDTDTELDLQNPEFAAAIADIASAIRGIPKDELASEEVRQHRRTVRTAWAAGVVVTVLAIAAVGFGFQSSRNADEAARQAAAAEQSAAEASRQAEIAQQERDVATAERDRADQQTAIAEAAAVEAELATIISRSASLSEENPEVSILLALEAHRRDPKPETEQAVLNALGSSPLPNFVSRLPALNQPTDPCGLIAISSDRFTEFGTVDGVLVTRDTQSGAITEHGPASFECGRWIGSDALDRRVEVSADGMHIRTGPLEGTWEVERLLGEPLSLINRSFPASGLLAFYTAPDGVDSVIVLNEGTLEQVGPTQSEGDFLLSVTLDRSGSRLALGWVSIGAPDGDGLTVVVDVRTGEELLRITTLEPARGLAFDEEAEQLVAGLVRGTFVTIDLATGEVVAEASSSMTHPVEIAVNEDGGIVAASAGQVLTLDRTTGSVGPSIDLIDVNESLIRADGSVLNISSDTELSVVDLAGSALVETAWPIEPSAFVLMRDGVAGVAAPREDIGAYTIDLATGDRRALALSREDGTPFFTEVIFPIAGSIWAFEFSAGRVEFHRWEDGSLRETVAWGLEGIRGNDQGEWLAGFGRAADGSERAQVFSFTEGRVTVSVPAQDTVSAHPTPDGGMHLLRADGMVLSYDNAGHLVNEINTYPDKPEDVFFTDLFVDPTSGDIAINTVGAGVLVVDTSTEQVVALTDFRNVAYMDFARNGELLVVSERDGTVRLWNLESGTSGGLVWDGTGDAKSVPWYDEATESVWVATSGWLLQVPLDPQQWIDRACEIVGRDMTQQEWDRFVPRGGPVQSACG